jgi:hypothetical protein
VTNERNRGGAGDPTADGHARFAFDDAPYVLGALSEDDRRAFEDHLAGCDRCQVQVVDLRGMPDLLGRADPSAWEVAEPPATLLPALLHEVTMDRRRRRFRTTFTGLAAACIVALLAIAGTQQWTRARTPHPAVLHAVSVTPPIEADVTLTAANSGTQIRLTCRSPGGGGYAGPKGPGWYHMVVYNRAGARQALDSWPGTPSITVDALSNWPRSEISRVEVQDDEGHALLKLGL